MRRILVVDDDADIREMTAELLRLRGYEVDTLREANEIFRFVKRTPPDVLLQDCHMPGLDLGRLIQTIRGDPACHSLPIVLFTASIEAEGFWRHIGANGFLRKPFDADDLESEIRQAIDRSKPDGSGQPAPMTTRPLL
jgi:CheY-like chemotaxis protein